MAKNAVSSKDATSFEGGEKETKEERKKRERREMKEERIRMDREMLGFQYTAAGMMRP